MALSANSLLWKIERRDLPGPSYLFGTMHIRRQGHLPVLKTAESVLPECDRFLAEMTLDEQPNPVDLPAPSNWSKHLSKASYQRMLRVIQRYGDFPAWQVPFLPPLFLINHISTRMLLGEEQPFYLDRHLWKLAGEYELERDGLETPDELSRLIMATSGDVQVKMLRQLTGNIRAFRKHLHKTNAFYEAENILQLYHSTRDGMGLIRKPFLLKRNFIMAKRLDEQLPSCRIFTAVGAAHLAGSKGILRLLKQKGYSLRAYQVGG